MHRGDGLPVLDAGQERPRPDDVAQRRASSFERLFDDLETSPGLRSGIVFPDGSSVRPERRRSGHRDDGPHAHGTRDADLRLVRAAAGNQLSHASRAYTTAEGRVDVHGRSVLPECTTLASCDPFAIPSTSRWTGAAIIVRFPRTKSCIVTRSRTSTEPMPSSLAG